MTYVYCQTLDLEISVWVFTRISPIKKNFEGTVLPTCASCYTNSVPSARLEMPYFNQQIMQRFRSTEIWCTPACIIIIDEIYHTPSCHSFCFSQADSVSASNPSLETQFLPDRILVRQCTVQARSNKLRSVSRKTCVSIWQKHLSLNQSWIDAGVLPSHPDREDSV